jgi:hypothetical protein
MLARLAVTAALILLGFAHAARADGDARCLGLVAYAEAAVDGTAGMDAVMRVVRNRIADRRFPDGACAVIAQALQFQPIAQSEVLKRVVKDPEGFNIPQVMGAHALPAADAAPGAPDGPRGGAAGAGPDWWGALLRQPGPDGRGQVPLVRRTPAHGSDRRARLHDPPPPGRAEGGARAALRLRGGC